MKQRVINLQELRKKQFKTLPFEGYWEQAIGKPESNFKMLLWGPEKSGKSTLCLRFCDYLAKYGKVAYNSWEEGISKTFQDRVVSNNIQSSRIFLLEKYTYDEMMDDSFKKKNYKAIVIDSIQYMSLSYEQYKQLTDKYRSKIFILISQANGKGRIKGGTDIAHAVDIKVHCFDGTARIDSRFQSQKTIQIFEKKPKVGDQIPLLIHHNGHSN